MYGENRFDDERMEDLLTVILCFWYMSRYIYNIGTQYCDRRKIILSFNYQNYVNNYNQTYILNWKVDTH